MHHTDSKCTCKQNDQCKLKIQIYTNLLSWMRSCFADCSNILFLETSLEIVLKKKGLKGRASAFYREILDEILIKSKTLPLEDFPLDLSTNLTF